MVFSIHLTRGRVVGEELTPSQARQVVESHPGVEALFVPRQAELSVGVLSPEGLQLVPVVGGEVHGQTNALSPAGKLRELAVEVLDTSQQSQVNVQHDQPRQPGELGVVERGEVEQVVGIFLIVRTGHDVHVGLSLEGVHNVSLVSNKVFNVNIGKLQPGNLLLV